jgi:hypothetical protein
MAPMRKASICLFLIAVLALGAALLAQNWRQVAVLALDASQDQTFLTVDSPDHIVVDKAILIESRDGKTKDTYEVKHVYADTVILKSGLKKEFLAGSRLYQ